MQFKHKKSRIAHMKPTIKMGIYEHYKGQRYEVIGFAHHTETKTPMVLYKALYDVPELTEIYGEDVVFTRPYELFIESVTIDGIQVPRFHFIGS